MKRIEFGEFRANETMRKHLNECLDTNWITMGPKVKELEKKFAEKFGYKYAVMVSSGTSADIAALLTLYEYGAKPGDEIIVPALSFIATSNAVRAAGFTPIWVDIKKETLNIDETLIEKVITSKTKAIMSVNTMGKPCKMDALRNLADKYRLKLISDSCESHLCKYQGKLMSEYADMCTYSGYSAHVLICCEGGVVGTHNEKMYEILQSVRSHGRPVNSLYFNHERYGLNLKPTDLHASIGLGSFEDLDETFYKRDSNLRKIRHMCSPLRDVAYLSEEDNADFNCPHGFSVTVKNPKHFPILIQTLDEYNIHHKRNFGCIPTQHGAFKDYIDEAHETYRWQNVTFPQAEYVGDYGIHIGCHPYLTDEEIDRICTAFLQFTIKVSQ